MHVRKTRTGLFATLAIAGLVASGLGTAGAATKTTKKSSKATKTTVKAATTIATVAPATTTPATGGPATGKPIKIMQTVSTPGDPSTGLAGLTAAVKSVNAAGGIGGRPIEVVQCDSVDANAASKCARDAVSDDQIIAAVGNSSNFGANFNPVLNEAGMASIAPSLFTAGDFNCPNCFGVQIGNLAVGGQVAVLWDLNKARKIVLPFLDVAAGQGLPPLINGGILAPRGSKLAGTVAIPFTAADVAPSIQQLPSDADGMAIALTLDLGAKVITQTRRLGYNYPIALPAGVFNVGAIKEFVGDKLATNLIIVSAFRLSGVGYDAFQVDMKAIGKAGTKEDNTQALQAWLGVQVFKDAAIKAGADKVTRKSLLDAMKGAMSPYDTKGLTPPLDWTKKQTALGGALPNIINPTVIAYKYDNTTGKLVELDPNFVNVFDPNALK